MVFSPSTPSRWRFQASSDKILHWRNIWLSFDYFGGSVSTESTKSIQYSTEISLITLTLIRNFAVALIWTHIAACVIYFISRQYLFDAEQTWLGDKVIDLNDFERYVTTLYWSVVTFTTVGYGDFSPVNPQEQIWGMTYMLINIVINSWIIGSITLLIVKNDEKTGNYRDTLETLDQYSDMHNFDRSFHEHLKTQLKLDFENQEVADEQVLKHFPSSVRRKVLRKLYLPYLNQTSLMEGIRQQFVDAFLSACNVEIFSPGEEIMVRNSISTDLYLLVAGLSSLDRMVDARWAPLKTPTIPRAVEAAALLVSSSTNLDSSPNRHKSKQCGR